LIIYVGTHIDRIDTTCLHIHITRTRVYTYLHVVPIQDYHSYYDRYLPTHIYTHTHTYTLTQEQERLPHLTQPTTTEMGSTIARDAEPVCLLECSHEQVDVLVQLDGLDVARITFQHHHKATERRIDLTVRVREGRGSAREGRFRERVCV
jgi:hypothetical protein